MYRTKGNHVGPKFWVVLIASTLMCTMADIPTVKFFEHWLNITLGISVLYSVYCSFISHFVMYEVDYTVGYSIEKIKESITEIEVAT